MSTRRQLLRYGIVGLSSNALGYLLYLGLTALGLGPKLAMSLLYLVGVLQTFVFNRRWTFGHGGGHGPAFGRYLAAYGLGYLLNLAVLYLLVDRWGQPHAIVQAVMIFVLAGLLFVLQKFWVFRVPASTHRDTETSG
ncbi:GtrA family protein [Paucibacter sp. XJ19-41]|uniref:GtrA family protein n=1 Tax=Paucibacter sp. XJ19-41 TaxID=2927824 RepID=UPI002349EBC4|nr:GtrA family protein [Paucibacter sp. XJ19-41]MDC6166121.1 GtrA family protein [Paucibacter sp. XJ19-41]